ncbi:MAG TPA: twin-arginine translocase TatA/TatE family subunit [Rhizomicrobium sp.]|jgi:sec-independent protein translocase protein TatA
MGALSIWHVLIIAMVALLMFGGRGKVSDLMGDFAKGIRSFRAGLNEPEQAAAPSHGSALKALADSTDR